MLFTVARRARRWRSTALSSLSSRSRWLRGSRCYPTPSVARSRTSPAFSRDDSRPVHEPDRTREAGDSVERGRHGGPALASDRVGRSALPADRPPRRSRLLVLPPPLSRRTRRRRSRLGSLGAFDETWTRPLGRRGRREPASVAPVASGYEHS